MTTALSIDRPHAVPSEVARLTAAIAAGDTEAFARFYRRWFDLMYADARRATGRDEAFCLDVVHDAMLRVIRSMRPLAGEDDLRRWLGAVVRACAYDRLRAERRRRRRDRIHGADGAAGSCPPAADDDRLRWLEEQLRTLDDPSLKLLVMRHRFGWTLRRIGEIVRLEPGAVDGRLRRIVTRLRRRARGEGEP